MARALTTVSGYLECHRQVASQIWELVDSSQRCALHSGMAVRIRVPMVFW